MVIEIDKQSGFCFGVTKAIQMAEKLLTSDQDLFCLGEIVHNREETGRLSSMGMKTIGHEALPDLEAKNILIRTHGEPPSTYEQIKANGNVLFDATCPVVLKLQDRIRKSYQSLQSENGQLVIFGKAGHPELLGLLGQTEGNAILIHTLDDLIKIDYHRPIELYSQTTMPVEEFQKIGSIIQMNAQKSVLIHDTICRQVSNRIPRMKEFSVQYDVILFVSGANSSNGKALFSVCKKCNPQSYFISTNEDVLPEWFDNAESIGICGATSTPVWLMEQVKTHVSTILNL